MSTYFFGPERRDTSSPVSASGRAAVSPNEGPMEVAWREYGPAVAPPPHSNALRSPWSCSAEWTTDLSHSTVWSVSWLRLDKVRDGVQLHVYLVVQNFPLDVEN